MNGTPLVFRHVEKNSGVFAGWREDAPPHPGGNADDIQNERVARKAIRKTMKTKGRQIDLLRSYMELRDTPTPGCFAQRVRKLLKRKDWICKKSGKRE